MALPNQLFLSDLLSHRVRCDRGMDHGPGISVWMHPPVHRLLGWASKPSNLRLSRDIWRLDQLKALGNNEAFVKGEPSNSDQATLDRLPTLFEADLFNKNGERLASIVDFLFESKTGNIINYFVSRSDPRIPGTSRWRLTLDHIIDQQPGMVSTDILCLDDIPLYKSSVRQNLISKSRDLLDQFQEFSFKASNRLEGWLEEPPWEDINDREGDYLRKISTKQNDPLLDWDEDSLLTNSAGFTDLGDRSNGFPQKSKDQLDSEEDPWV